MKVVLKREKIAFPRVWTPEAFKGGEGQKSYSVIVLITPDSDNHKNIKKAIKQVAKDAWGDKAASVLKDIENKGRSAFHEEAKRTQSGDEIEGFEGMYWLSARKNAQSESSAERPALLDRDKSPLREEDGKIYGGAVCDVSVDIWAQTARSGFGNRICCQLRGIRYVEEGTRFGGGGAASPEEFDDLDDTGEDDGSWDDDEGLL